jgi:hypothetical protein
MCLYHVSKKILTLYCVSIKKESQMYVQKSCSRSQLGAVARCTLAALVMMRGMVSSDSPIIPVG